MERLTPYEIPCGPLNNIAEAAAQPQVEAREMLRPVGHHTLGTLPLVDTPIKLSRTPGGIRGTSPDMGQDSRDLLAGLLGLDGAAIEALVEREVVWDERPTPDLG